MMPRYVDSTTTQNQPLSSSRGRSCCSTSRRVDPVALMRISGPTEYALRVERLGLVATALLVTGCGGAGGPPDTDPKGDACDSASLGARGQPVHG